MTCSPPTPPGKWKEALSEWAATADERRRHLGGRLGEKPEPWVVDALGPVPTDDILRRIEWEEKAGWAAAARELAGHTDPNDALGPPPPAGLAEKYAVWRTPTPCWTCPRPARMSGR
jgi:hypothetical protein